jgi:hypothetical protein
VKTPTGAIRDGLGKKNVRWAKPSVQHLAFLGDRLKSNHVSPSVSQKGEIGFVATPKSSDIDDLDYGSVFPQEINQAGAHGLYSATRIG